jgi:hypothetical protein
MVKASPYVIRNISAVLEKEDFDSAKELCEKFSARYSEDIELVRICDRYTEYQETKDVGMLDELNMSLERLSSTRIAHTGVSDGTALWYHDKRPNMMNVVRVV